MEMIYSVSIKITALFSASCILKLLLPGGAMKRGAAKAVDIVTLLSLIRIISGAMVNG